MTTHNRPALSEAVSAALCQFGYPFDVNECGTDFRFKIVTVPRLSWRSQMVLTGDVLQIVTYLTDRLYPPHQGRAILELVCRLNATASVLGSFHFHWNTGSVEFHYGIDLRGQQDPQGAVSRALNAIAFPVNVWRRCFDRYNIGVPPSDIVSAAMIECGCVSHQPVSNSTRRVLFKVLNGGQREREKSSDLDVETSRSLDIILAELTITDPDAHSADQTVKRRGSLRLVSEARNL